MSRRGTLLLAIGLTAAGLTVPGTGAHADTTVARYIPSADDHYINYVEPKVAAEDDKSALANPQARLRAEQVDNKHRDGNPVAARILAAREAEALRTGKNPFEFIYKKRPQKQEARLLTLLVEFSDTANDDFSGVQRQDFLDPATCVTEPAGTLLNGPLHNQLPNPAASGKDNFSMWVPDFSPKHYNDMLYSDKGITTRVRPDLKDPRDGKPGVDISGHSMKKMYEEMSKGAYTVTGEAVGWIKVPHSEGYYGAARCGERVQDMSGHPSNPRFPNGNEQLPIDAVATLAQQQPDFPWADYDVEDITDADGDGNYNEPDGVIDHLVLVHAGADKSGGGGAQGSYALWAHSSDVAGGSTIPGSDKRISNYILQGEDAGVGVFAHEYGHDLGLPDLYDNSGSGGDSDIAFWDLMANGSHSGPIFQSMPTHMGLWDKWILGWANPKVIDPGDRRQLVTVGQASRTPRLTEDGIRVNLPGLSRPQTTPHSGAKVWQSGNDQPNADVRITRTIQVPAEAKFWMWNSYAIEAEWDFGFVEVSTDNGATWAEQKIYTEGGALVSTDDGYADPNGSLARLGGKKYGLTGSQQAWRHDYVDLAAFAGKTVQLRLRYMTDELFMENGWFVDDLSLTSGATTVWSDDVEQGLNGWTPLVTSHSERTTGKGWQQGDGVAHVQQYYLAEWRTADGFDKGLHWAYDTNWFTDNAWNVERVRYNAPGLLITLRNHVYDVNDVDASQFDQPSIGSKGSLLAVDSHFEPLRYSGEAADHHPTLQKNLNAWLQPSNAAFGFAKTLPLKSCTNGADVFTLYCNTFAAQRGVQQFTDAKTWYPGIEVRDGSLYFRDRDASVAVPSRDHLPYTTRVVNADGSPATEQYGRQLSGGHVLGTGNPGDAGVQNGVQIKLVAPLPGNLGVIVDVTPAAAPQ
ncbi:immune inhibitor A domain-containing protein [Nonomuraea sp. NPDC050663]|uniref:immune inhibitor A domain-containing protein n=1 Tax=Nonomuraea sp. NPDC050663 TaxID=3364370 RepID=UPI00378B2557